MTLERPTGTIFFILMAVLTDMIAVGVIMPVLPALGGGFSASKADNAFWYGFVASSFGAVARAARGPPVRERLLAVERSHRPGGGRRRDRARPARPAVQPMVVTTCWR